ncbi:hypothetical protein N656DRAFT_795795 [Canariomyces notabilis]|uniref:Major facilitator superfamily (MFS) profile domain-containing protein n=1 Tax=Canariomyces notabilis TaxID=2074819 RepID=A0AAN6TJK1_9PEZI|nr:hypothetical protein N656DRAFT_795795 [Canariomyces arenarius]
MEVLTPTARDQLQEDTPDKNTPPDSSVNTTLDNVLPSQHTELPPSMLINPSPSHTNNDRDGPMNGSSSSSSSGPNPSATATHETVFLVLFTLTQLVQSIPLGAGINSGLAIGSSLGSPPSSAAWIVASYPLTQGAFVLIGGRLGEVYGHKAVLAAGALW